ncbi:MAG: radical SAM protein [Candidatus Omnitrophica bacterium]|nr:radical SAM protein [Candidatus Omnitrophota bacterium]
MTKEVAQNDIALLRAIIHEDIEAIMQILMEEGRRNKNSKYQGIKELILKYFPPNKENLMRHYPIPDYDKFSTELYVNHIVAKTFEWIVIVRDGVILKDEIPDAEKDFLKAIEPIIESSRHNYFTGEFWNSNERNIRIRAALNSGMRFYQTASDDRKDPELGEGARSHAPPDAPAGADNGSFLIGMEDDLFIKAEPDYLEDMPREVVSLVRSVSSIDQLEEMLKKIALEVQNGAEVRKEFLPHLEKIALLFGLEHNTYDVLTSWASVFKNMQVPQGDRGLIDGLFHADANFVSPYAFNEVIPVVDRLLDGIDPQPERYTIDARIKQYLSLVRKLRSVLSEIEGQGVYKHPMTVREVLDRALRHKEVIAGDADHYLDDLIGFKLFINNIGYDAAQRKDAMAYYSGLVEKQLSSLGGVSIKKVRRETHVSGFETVNIYLHGLLNHRDFGELPVKIQLRLISGIFKEAAMYYTYKVYKRWDSIPPWVQPINFEEITSFRQLQELLLANFKRSFESRGPLNSVKTGDMLIMPAGRQPGFDITRVSERAAGEIDYRKFLITGPYPAGGQGGFRFTGIDKRIKEKGFFGITAQERYTYINLLLHNFKLLDFSEAISESCKGRLRNLSQERRRSFAHVSKYLLFDVLDAPDTAPAPLPSLRGLEYLPDSPKILLISPYEKRDLKVGSFLAPAMGVYRLAGYLRLFGIRVDIFDPNLDDEKNLDELIRKEDYDFIGSSVYEPTLENDINLAAHLKQISPRSIFIAGGEGAYYNRGRLFGKDSPFVVITRGFGEFSLLDMVAMHMRKSAEFMKDPDEMRGIEGLLVRTDRGTLETPLSGRIECDDYRVISLFSDTSVVPYERYWAYMEGLYSPEQLKKRKDISLDSTRTVRVVTESHCPMGCSFCTSTHFLDDSISGKRQPVLFLTADEIMLTLRNVIKYHPEARTIFFNDDNFMFNRKRVMDLCDKIERDFGSGRLKFIALGRVDSVDFEMLRRMKEVGFVQLNYGIESLSDRVLHDMKKNIKAKKNIEGLEITLLAGIRPLIALIPFYPTATMDDVRETMEVAVEFVNIGAGLTYWPFVEAFKGASITKDAESGKYDLTDDGKYILPQDKRVRGFALKAVEGTGAVIEDIRKRYGIEGRLPHAVDVLAFFIAFYRAAGMDAGYIELAVKSAMLGFINGAAGAHAKDGTEKPVLAGEADMVSSDKRVKIAGLTDPDYYRYRKKNDPAVSEYGVTMIAGLPMPNSVLKVKEIVNKAVSDCVGENNVYLFGSSHTQTTISPVLRSDDRPITSIINARGDGLDTEKMLDVVRDARPFDVIFSKVRIDGRGGISLLGMAAGESAEILLALRKGLIVDAKFDGRIQDLNAELHITIGYIKNFDKLSREQKEKLVKSIERALAKQLDPGAFRVDRIELVYYQHRSLSKIINKIDLKLGVDHPELRNKVEKVLFEKNVERIDIVEVDSVTQEETVVGVATRDEAHAKGLLHRISNVIMISPDGELVLQKRAPWKTSFPNLWSITGGHVSSGKTYRRTAISEIKQELGIKCDEARLIPVGIEGSYAYSRIDTMVNNRERKALYYYVLNEDEDRQLRERKELLVKMPPEELQSMGNEGEVVDLVWKNADDLERELRQGPEKSIYAPGLLPDIFPDNHAMDMIKRVIASTRRAVQYAGQRSHDAEEEYIYSANKIVKVAGAVPVDYERYHRKNDPATNEYGVTMVAGLPVSEGALGVKSIISGVVSSFAGDGNFIPYDAAHTHATISAILRSRDEKIVSLAHENGPINTDKVLDMVKETKPFTVKFTNVKISGHGGITLRGVATAETAENLLSLRKRLAKEANFESRNSDQTAELHVSLGHIRNFDKLSREDKEALAQMIEDALKKLPDFGTLKVNQVSLVYYQHRSLSKIINKIPLEFGKDYPELRGEKVLEQALLSDSQEPEPIVIRENVKTIYEIGDIHGSYDGFISLLNKNGLIDGNGDWCAPAGTVLVQTGDFIAAPLNNLRSFLKEVKDPSTFENRKDIYERFVKKAEDPDVMSPQLFADLKSLLERYWEDYWKNDSDWENNKDGILIEAKGDFRSNVFGMRLVNFARAFLSFKTLQKIKQLQEQAKENGSEVIAIYGNEELILAGFSEKRVKDTVSQWDREIENFYICHFMGIEGGIKIVYSDIDHTGRKEITLTGDLGKIEDAAKNGLFYQGKADVSNNYFKWLLGLSFCAKVNEHLYLHGGPTAELLSLLEKNGISSLAEFSAYMSHLRKKEGLKSRIFAPNDVMTGIPDSLKPGERFTHNPTLTQKVLAMFNAKYLHVGHNPYAVYDSADAKVGDREKAERVASIGFFSSKGIGQIPDIVKLDVDARHTGIPKMLRIRYSEDGSVDMKILTIDGKESPIRDLYASVLSEVASGTKSFPAGEKDMPKSDRLLQDESRQLASGTTSYDSEFATVLLTDLLYAQLHEDRNYEVKYDTSRLTNSQIEIIEEYARLLQLRSSHPDSIKLRPFSSAQGSKESLIAVYCTGKDFKGEGHVDVAIPDGELKEYLLRITGMVNIALASSNIPDDLSREEVDKYRPIMSYIKNQYKAILGEELAIPDSPEDILKVIRRIVIGLPKSMRMDAGQIEEFNRLAKQALTAA